MNILTQTNVGTISKEQWDSVVSILVDKPQSVDRRVAGRVELSKNENTNDKKTLLFDKLIEKSNDYISNTENQDNIIVQKLVSKNTDKFSDWYRVVVIKQFSVLFIPFYIENKDIALTKEENENCDTLNVIKDATSVAYKLSYIDSDCILTAEKGLEEKQKYWLQSVLLPTACKWLQDKLTGSNPGSLQLINLEDYVSTYKLLKDKYAGQLVANWSESSDPEKSVHEDIGIAAYLSCLWGDKKVSFVDLGCGNGLLVYLLNSEGHNGRGIDLRKRKIWSTFPESIQSCLLEQAIVPSLQTKFQDVDWILGNHSDELTPWIPVFACLSSPTTKYWVLPCCAFNLTSKYQRKNCSISMFRDYLDYVAEMGKLAGFQVKEDRMRIPSTKRICLVGSTLSNQDYESRKQKVLQYVSKQIENFKPRDKVEKVRNCTQIGLDIIELIVKMVVNICLKTKNLIPKKSEGFWNAGGEISLGDVVGQLQEEKVDLSRLKAECGGLQTLLKNNHSVFQVVKGKVKLRVPSSAKPMFDNAKIKRRPCWFHDNHPDGCLLDNDSCTWIHSTSI